MGLYFCDFGAEMTINGTFGVGGCCTCGEKTGVDAAAVRGEAMYRIRGIGTVCGGPQLYAVVGGQGTRLGVEDDDAEWWKGV